MHCVSTVLFLTLVFAASARQEVSNADITQLELQSVGYVYGLLIGEHSVYYEETGRAKRAAFEEDWTSAESIRCAARCANLYKSAMLAFKDSSESDEAEEAQATNPVSAFGQLCDAVRPFLQCLDECPSVPPQVLAGAEPLRFLCIDRFEDMKKNIPCIENQKALMQARCKPRCHRFQDSFNKTMALAQEPFLSILYSDRELRGIITGTCHYIKCVVHCATPILRSQCGEGSVNLVSGAIRKIAGAVVVYDHIAHNGRLISAECIRLARMNDQTGEHHTEIPRTDDQMGPARDRNGESDI